MGKKITLLLLLAFAYVNSQAQANLDNMYKQANEMAAATVKGDYATLIKYTHPNVVKMMGGEQKAVALIQQGTSKMKEKGVKFKKASIGKATQTIVSKANIQCIVPQTLDMEMMQMPMHITSYLLAISYDQGKKWYFSETKESEKLRKIIPEMDKKLVIPQIKMN